MTANRLSKIVLPVIALSLMGVTVPRVLRQSYIDGSVSHQAVRCSFIFMSHSGSMAITNKTADSRLKAHPKGTNQHVQHCVIAV